MDSQRTFTGCHVLISSAAVLLALAATVAGCAKTAAVPAHTDHAPGTTTSKSSALAAAQQPPLLISPEDLITVNISSLANGPLITGSVQPERRADLRAEVAAVVLQVLKENGDAVRRGDVLVRLDDSTIRDSLNSAEAAAHAVDQAYEQAERQYQRLSKLRAAGMVSTQAVEDAEVQRNNAQSDLQAAKSRAVQARQQLQRTAVRAPFDGIVSDRKVSAGDTAQIGKELAKVIDPRSMRFEGLVSADSIGAVKVGQAVVFRVHGYAEQDFTGKVTRVNPAANITTRQVEVLVSFTANGLQPRLAGLYAEGRIAATHTASLTIPASALVKDGEQGFAWRINSQSLQKVPVVVGERDLRSGAFVLKSGLAAGDRLLRHPNDTLVSGQPVEVSSAPETSPGAA